ncbi:MAG: hypothetical protein JWM88_3225 [Verrucomicrobia bacterium]|nr:hypothetical protein [Verrucomicrobiota bacterium]
MFLRPSLDNPFSKPLRLLNQPMSSSPPLLSDETLVRVLRHARANGTGVLMVASMFALLNAVGGEIIAVLAWLLVAGTGAMSLHGASLLDHGQPRGINWLVGSQLFCMGLILSLCAWQLVHVDLEPLRAALTSDLKTSVQQTGLTENEFLQLSYRLTYAFISCATLLYQGSMALYYLKRRAAVAAAFPAE